MNLAFTLNGQPCATEAPEHWTVLDLLRDGLGLMGTKYGCGEGVCGACTVLADGRPIRACLVLAAHARGRAIVTVEGLERDGRLDPIQTAFAERGAAQCGYCTPGIMLVAKALLLESPAPTEHEVREALSGNLCRCTGYTKIIEAVLAVAGDEVSVRLHPFRLVEPESLPDAIEALGRLDGEARLVAGGTALVAMIRLGLVKPDRLISLQRVPALSQIRVESGSLELGAMTTHADIERSRVVRDGWPLLVEAVRRVATPAIRTSGTIGGNLAYAESASDPAPALLCLHAEVRVDGPRGSRTVPIARFFRGFYEAALEPGEIVTAIRVPPTPAGARGGYIKYTSRSAEDKPLIGVAALVALDPSGRCVETRIGLGGAAPTPIRAERAERTLRGETLTDAAARAAAEAAAHEADPLSDLMGSADYRREMIRVWVRRLLVGLRDGAEASGAR